MKLVLSRKGFDAENGGCPSPIFPNGRLYSLPIDYGGGSRTRYRDIGAAAGIEGSAMGSVVEHLTGGRVRGDALAHLDPDLDAGALPRLPGWRPTFGQVGAAQGHLENQGVGSGDLFLFYGWFRRVVPRRDGRWRYDPGAPDLHVIFGWLQIEEVLDVGRAGAAWLLERRPWLRDHPHLRMPRGDITGRNAVYVGSDRLRLPGLAAGGLPGGGVLGAFDARLVLTAPDAPGRSHWRLPGWFRGRGRVPSLSYHGDPARWTEAGDGVGLRAVGKGQEFVLDCRDRPLAAGWLAGLLGAASA